MEIKDFEVKDFTMEYFHEYLNLLNEIILEKRWLGTNSTYSYGTSFSYLKNKEKLKVPFILILHNNKVIGWSDADPYHNKSGILAIGIKKEYRDKGIGKYLLELIINKSKNYGYKKLVLRVRAKNERAITLYKKYGFIEDEYIEGGLYLDREKIDLVKMSLILI